MQVHLVQNNNTQKKHPQFKGFGDIALRYLATNQGVGANLTDLSFMVLPRTISDAQRGPAACVETARREASGTANHSLIGAYGIGSGAIVAAMMGINKKYGTNANSIMAAPETLNILAASKAEQFKNKTNQIDYLKDVLSNIKAFNPNSTGADKEGYIKLSQDTVDEVAKILNKALSTENPNFKTWSKNGTDDSFRVALNKIIADTGAESKYILEKEFNEMLPKQGDAKILRSETSLKLLMEDIFKLSDSFNKKEVVKAFENQVKNNKDIHSNEFIKNLTKFNKTKAAAGFALGTAIGMSIQPLNIYLTKLKTGSDGFVGVEGRSKDNSTGFLGMKLAASAAFGGLTLASLQTGLKGFMGKMAFTGFWPTISQLKGIYGLTIISRILATRDKDELREALTKDTLGFLSWLVLGDFVNKITADTLDKSVMNRTKEVADKNWANRIFNSTLKTRDEILIETLSQNGKDVVKKDGNKTIAKTFKEMMKELDTLPEEVKVATKKRLKTLNKAQLAGYAFSGLVLGLGIPNLNIYITNKLDKQRKEKALAKQAQA